MNDDFIRELTRSPSHASLSARDLEDLAKMASDMYLCKDTPLTEAVVKVASDHPGISQEQVKRVVEMANSSTFQRLFEKQAGDKNVEFSIADPSEVLRMMDHGASAPVMKVASVDYASAPPAHRARDLEADLALAQVFGVIPEPTSAMKTAMIDPAKGQAALELFEKKEQAAKAQKKVIETLMQPPQAAPAPSMDQLGLGGQPAAGAPPSPMMAPKPEAVPGLPKMGNAMMGYGQADMGPGPAPGPEATMDDGGIVPDDGDEDLHTRVNALPGEIVINPEKEGLTPEEVFDAITTAKELKAEGEGELEEVTAPEEEEAAPESVKEAMAYFKSNRPGANLIGRDLVNFTSLDRIKTAARANERQYNEANPHGDLFRAYQILQKHAEDVTSAVEENEHHWKVATAELGHHVLQHVLGGGNLGEVAHLMAGLGSEEQVKTAMQNIMPAIEKRLPDWQMTNLQVGLINYEMEKGASARVANPDHPIAKAFAGVIKLSEAHDQLSEAKAEIVPMYKEAQRLLSEASKTRVKA